MEANCMKNMQKIRRVQETKDVKAQHYIVTTIDRSVMQQHIIICTTAKDMFKKLKSIYEQDTEQQKCLLLIEF